MASPVDHHASGIAVVIPYYDGARWIERALDSVFSQSVPAAEVIVVNDGSKPAQREALGALQRRHDFRILDKPNGGQGSARNAGVAATRAPLIAFLDQDDFYLPHHNEDLLGALPARDPRLGFVYADLCDADGDGNIIHSNMLRQQISIHPKAGHVIRILRDDMFILPSAALIKREVFEAMGGFDEQFTGYEDDDLFLRMFRAGYTNYFLDKPVTVWCRHEGSTSWSLRMSRSRLRYFKKLVDSYRDDPTFENYYFRDGLLPRFEPKFLWDVERAIERGDDDNLPELRQILAEFVAIVEDQPHVAPVHKAKLRAETYVLTHLPAGTVRAMKKVARLPMFRKIVSRARLR